MKRIRLSLVVLLAGLAVGPSSVAVGATYDVTACADHAALGVGAFVPLNSNAATLTTSSSCMRDPVGLLDGLVATDRGGSANTPAGAAAAWTMIAAPGTTIVTLRARRFLGKRDNTWHVWVRTGEGQVLETCQIVASLSCTEGALPTSPQSLRTYAGINTQSVAFGISCVASIGDCVHGISLNAAWAAVYSATATIEDPAPPTLQPIGGSLVAPVAWHRGVEQATLAASDASGIKRLELLVDGVPVTAVDQACDYSQMRPCPSLAQLSAGVELARLADGPHQIAARASDAANQTAMSSPTTIAVDTRAPVTPLELAVTRNADGTYAARWRNPDQGAGAPVTAAHYQFCPLGSDRDCVGGGVVPGDGVAAIESMQVPAGGAPWDLLVWLQDAAGNSDRSGAARRIVDTQPSRGGGASGGGGDGSPGRADGPNRKRSAGLRIARISRQGRTLRVSGKAARGVHGRVAVTFRRSRHARPRARRIARIHSGRFSASLILSVRDARIAGVVTAHVQEGRSHRAQTVLRAVRQARAVK